MRRPPDSVPSPRSVLPGEVLALREAGRRLGLQKQALCDAQKAGLKTVLVGRVKFTTGDWVRQFVEGLAERAEPVGAEASSQGAGQEGNGHE